MQAISSDIRKFIPKIHPVLHVRDISWLQFMPSNASRRRALRKIQDPPRRPFIWQNALLGHCPILNPILSVLSEQYPTPHAHPALVHRGYRSPRPAHLARHPNMNRNPETVKAPAPETKTRGNNETPGDDDDDDKLGIHGLTHPMDPHKPSFSELLPEAWRPYPSFEGWFIRILDPVREFSAAVILATNYASGESQVTILFALGKNSSSGDVKRGGHTYAVAVKTKDAGFKRNGNLGEKRGVEPEGFEWEANGIGRIVFTPHVTEIDFTVEGYNFKAHLTKELLWDAHNSENGPEGWARYVTIFPTHWYVYSLGSAVEYSFTNLEEKIHSEGSAFGHVEKNWGHTFPAGHVWLQAFSSNNTAQVCCAGAHFELNPNENLCSPYIFVLGYRSPKLQLHFRSNDLGIVFKDMNFAPLESCFSITAIGPSHTVEVKAYAPYDTFSPPVLAPLTKVDWKPACRESYGATVEIKVYVHVAWGIPGTKILVETQKLEFAALEFGEDLLSQASKSVETELISAGTMN